MPCSGSFGIGTSLTNDFKKSSSGGTEKSKALNMVIKIADVNGSPCIKISDEIMKVSFRRPDVLKMNDYMRVLTEYGRSRYCQEGERIIWVAIVIIIVLFRPLRL